MIRILSEKIHDNRFLRLIQQMLKAGYLEDWKYHETLSGAPQGGVVSPVLSNIYLHKLDVYRRDSSDPAIHPRETTETQPRIQEDEYARISGHAHAGTGPRSATCAANCANCPRATRKTPGTVGCATPATPMIISWGSSDRRPKPRPSRISWHGSCATTSPWNSTRTRRWSPTPVPGQPATSATRSSSSTATRRSPTAAGRSTGPSRYGYHWT